MNSSPARRMLPLDRKCWHYRTCSRTGRIYQNRNTRVEAGFLLRATVTSALPSWNRAVHGFLVTSDAPTGICHCPVSKQVCYTLYIRRQDEFWFGPVNGAVIMWCRSLNTAWCKLNNRFQFRLVFDQVVVENDPNNYSGMFWSAESARPKRVNRELFARALFRHITGIVSDHLVLPATLLCDNTT